MCFAAGAGSSHIDISYSIAMQPLIELSIGGQSVKLVFDASSGNTAVFVKETGACLPDTWTKCYSYNYSLKHDTVAVCQENGRLECDTGQGSKYLCKEPEVVRNISAKIVHARDDLLVIDGLQYAQTGIEAKDSIDVTLTGSSKETVTWTQLPVRLLVRPMSTPQLQKGQICSGYKAPLPLFEETNGLFGASGPTLSCRNESVWGQLLKKKQVKMIILDFSAPPQAMKGEAQDSEPSRVVFDEIKPSVKGQLVWSQPKQTGDVLNDGMHELLLYHPKVCGVDLLYNTSSNWLAVVDTSGPCLTLPSFFFDRLRSRVSLKCPFKNGEASCGRLCSPDRGGDGSKKLPSFSFQLQDSQQPSPTRITLPLERLVFKGEDGTEQLCVARADDEASRNEADMMFAHISLGSLVVSAVYTVLNLQNHTVGLASKSDASEASEELCTASVQCVSAMQTYYPPRNVCIDPPCSEYFFMHLDETAKVCAWSPVVPVSFGLLLVALALLDLLSHRLYKQSIRKASEFSQ
jgi:hypothetical protein